MDASGYYSITTRKFVLRCAHRDWLDKTQELYNKVILFYFDLYLERQNQGERLDLLNSQQSLRRLEVLTIKGRDQQAVEYPLPWNRLPLYFRRAAINEAICASKSYMQRQAQSRRMEVFHCAVTFYKNSYRKLSENSVQLKVWTGEEWVWLSCRLSSNYIPSGAETMSPSLILKDKGQFLNIPVRVKVSDGRKVRDRVQKDVKICAVQFSNRDALMTAVIMNRKDGQINLRFFRGGKEYTRLCNHMLDKIKLSDKMMGLDREQQESKKGSDETEALPLYNRRYWMKLKHITEYYSHLFSRQLVDYCVEQDAGILVLPEYDKAYSKYVMNSAGNWSPVHLSRRIRAQLFYKAWREGIIVLETSAYGCGTVCSACGGSLQKKGTDIFCENGHQLNRYLNSARNLGKKCLESFERLSELPYGS